MYASLGNSDALWVPNKLSVRGWSVCSSASHECVSHECAGAGDAGEEGLNRDGKVQTANGKGRANGR